MRRMFYKGAQVADDASKVCVLFDPRQRRIVHIHGSTALEGQAISNDDLETMARKHAEAFGHDPSGLKAAHVPVSLVRAGDLAVNESCDGIVQTGRALSRREVWDKIRQLRR